MGNDMRNEADNDQDTTTDSLEFEVNYRWTERNVLLSPRHRVPRDVQHDGCSLVRVKSITGADAPVAFQAPESVYVRGDLVDVGRDWRLHNGRIWTQLLTGERGEDAAAVLATPQWFTGRVSGWIDGDDVATVELNAAKGFNNYLIIDGTVWVSSNEPQYEVSTYGMSHNHGGTSLVITTRYDSRTADENFYAADEFDLAVARALTVAEKRGDTRSIERIKASGQIRVLIDSAVGTTVIRPSRISYLRPWDLTIETFRAELALFRDQIDRIAGAAIVYDGATAYDYTKLTSSQVSDYKAYISWGVDHGLI